jgi:hypothetical protein
MKPKKIINPIYTTCYVCMVIHADIANPYFALASLIYFGIWLGGLTLLDREAKKHI